MNPYATAHSSLDNFDGGGSATAFLVVMACFALCWWLVLGSASPLRGKMTKLQEFFMLFIVPGVLAAIVAKAW